MAKLSHYKQNKIKRLMHEELNPETNYIILCHAELRFT